jgi:hypothetical protein
MNRRKILEVTGLAALAGMLPFWPARGEAGVPMKPITPPQRKWVGEGRVLPISRLTSDFSLFAADRVKNLLVNLKKKKPVSEREILEALELINRYWVKPRLAENHKNEMEWRENEMRRRGWTEQEIEKAQAHYAEFHG